MTNKPRHEATAPLRPPALRSLLFVPASRPERFERACSSGADAVCLDLEDAVSPARKADARRAAKAFIETRRPAGVVVGVRINGLGTPWWEDDLAAVGAAEIVMLPKTASRGDIARVVPELGAATRLWPLVETADGLMRAWEIAAAERVEGVLFGAYDYAADIGCQVGWEPLLFARGQLAAACGRARAQLLDAPFGDLTQEADFAALTRRAKDLGCTGRACIHPAQVAVVNTIYTPNAEETAHARQVLAAFEEAQGGATRRDGTFVDLPVALAARRTLSRVKT